jgi:hypothetical protein
MKIGGQFGRRSAIANCHRGALRKKLQKDSRPGLFSGARLVGCRRVVGHWLSRFVELLFAYCVG